MEPRGRPQVLVVPTAGRRPSPDEIAAVEEGWSEAAVAQLGAAAAAVDRWLAEHPHEAARFVDDPAALIAELSEAGIVAQPVDDLLDVLRSRGGRERRIDTAAAVRFAARPELRSSGRDRYAGS